MEYQKIVNFLDKSTISGAHMEHVTPLFKLDLRPLIK